MALNVEVVRVQTEPKGKYQVASVDYKGPDGRIDNKKLVSFANKDVFKLFSNAQQGDVFDVTSEKDGNGYWQWTSAVSAGKVVAPASGNTATNSGTRSNTGTASPRSTYETPEERAKKQVYIVRQSSVSSAIDLLKSPKGTPDVEEVIAVAKQFESYVFDASTPVDEIPKEVVIE